MPDHPSAPRLALYEDWRRRLGKICDEMEKHFGAPGELNQDPLDSAVHVAFYVATREEAELRKIVTGREW